MTTSNRPDPTDSATKPQQNSPHMKSLKIGPHTVPILVGPKEVSEGNLGECTCFPDPEIRLYSLGSQWSYTTLLHEAIHLISDFYDLNLPEPIVRALDQQITLLLRNNPQLTKGLLQK